MIINKNKILQKIEDKMDERRYRKWKVRRDKTTNRLIRMNKKQREKLMY